MFRHLLLLLLLSAPTSIRAFNQQKKRSLLFYGRENNTASFIVNLHHPQNSRLHGWFDVFRQIIDGSTIAEAMISGGGSELCGYITGSIWGDPVPPLVKTKIKPKLSSEKFGKKNSPFLFLPFANTITGKPFFTAINSTPKCIDTKYLVHSTPS
ncbi:MAG: hypothetical protein L3J39_09045 [Verrucomicrobiales bacterium]|nr:hypothetical protein [Verrucomicrobiales bacterium]